MYNYVIEPKQTEKARSDQVENNAGGFVWTIDKWARLQRFLVLGSETNTYYQKAHTLTLENARCVEECIAEDPIRVIDILRDTRTLPKHDTALFVLAVMSRDICSGITQFNFNRIVRTGTHLFQFLSLATKIRGWGRGLQRLVKGWYTDKDLQSLEYQCAKYQNREGWTHRDVLRCCHLYAPEAKMEITNLIRFLRKPDPTDVPHDLGLFQAMHDHKNMSEARIIRTIQELGLTHEMIPSEKRTPEVWQALMEKMPLGALIRNLGNLSNKGVIGPGKWDKNAAMVSRLTNQEYIHKSHLHPFSVLLAHSVYGAGRGVRGSLTWEQSPDILAALSNTFHSAFDNVTPTGKRIMLAIDVSGSMWWSPISGTHLQAGDAAAAMSLVTNRTEEKVLTYTFSTQFSPLNVERHTSLTGMQQALRGHTFGGTDCALPMIHAMKHKIPVDAFIVYTDNETWAGRQHPAGALKEYRRKMNIPNAKLIVVGFTSTNFSIADPQDPGMLDVVGFDASAPAVIADFIR